MCHWYATHQTLEWGTGRAFHKILPGEFFTVYVGAAGGVVGKENEARWKAAAAASAKVTAVKKSTSVAAAPSAPTKQASKALAPAPRKAGILPGAATKPALGKGWKS